MASQAQRARCWVVAWALVFGLTPERAIAAPPAAETEADAAPVESEVVPVEVVPVEPTPSVAPAPAEVELTSTAVAVVVVATAIDDEGRARGPAIELGAMPVHASLAAGRWRFETRGRGYRAFAREVELAPGQEVKLQLEPELIEGALLEVRASNEASEGASVLLDGVELCSVPCRASIEPGTHEIEVSKRRHKPLRNRFDAVQADEIVFDVALEPATSRAPALVTGTVAVASLTTAVVFTARSVQARRSLREDLDAGVQYDQDDARIDNGRRDAIIASAMYGATAVVGALTLYYLLRQSGRASQAKKQRRSLAWQVSPGFARNGGALVLTVGF